MAPLTGLLYASLTVIVTVEALMPSEYIGLVAVIELFVSEGGPATKRI